MIYSWLYYTKYVSRLHFEDKSDFELRIYDGTNTSHEGALQVRLKGSDWGYVCAKEVPASYGQPICRHLGYRGARKYMPLYWTAGHTQPIPIYMDIRDVILILGEQKLAFYEWGKAMCKYEHILHVACAIQRGRW